MWFLRIVLSLWLFCVFSLAAHAADVGDLTQAVEFEQQRDVEAVLKQGVDINGVDSAGFTALGTAVYIGDVSKARFLLDKGADVNARGPFGNTALMRAVDEPYKDNHVLEIVQLLVKRGALVDARDASDFTALIIAAGQNRVAVVEFLLGKGADPNLKNKYGQNAATRAATRGHGAMVDLLLKRGTTASEEEHAALLNVLDTIHIGEAAQKGDVKTMRRLLRPGLPLDIQDELGLTALHKASRGGHTGAERGGHLDAIQLLLQFGASVNSRDENGETALMRVDVPAARALLKAGIDVNARDDEGNTALHIAISDLNYGQYDGGGEPKIVELLLDSGADVNARDGGGATPLLLAINRLRPFPMRYLEMIRLLRKHGAAVDIADKYGHTPLMAAASRAAGYVSYHSPQYLRLFMQIPRLKTWHFDLPLEEAWQLVVAADKEVFYWTLNASANIDARTSDGATTLMQVCGGSGREQ